MRKIVIVAAFLVVLFAVFSTSVSAQSNFRSAEVSRLEREEIVDRDYFAAGEKVVVSGTVQGDAYIAGGNVLVDGNIEGDLLVAGGDVQVLGTVGGSVRAAGGNVTVSGSVGRNLTLVSGDAKVESTAALSGSVAVLGGNVVVAAPVPGGLNGAAGRLMVSSAVGRGIVAAVGQLDLSSKASVGGDLTYWSDRPADIAKEASVSGQVVRNDPQKIGHRQRVAEADRVAKLGLSIFFLLSSLVTGLVLVWVLPNFVGRVTQTLKSRPGASLGVGLLALVVTPVVAVLLMLTVVAIPLGMFLMLGYFAFLWFANVFAAFAVGQFVSEKTGKRAGLVLSLVVGLLVLGVVDMLPLVGMLARLTAFLMGLGSLVLTKGWVYAEFRRKKLL